VSAHERAGAEDGVVERWLHRLGDGLLVLAGLANFGIFVIVLLAVGMRYVVGSPFAVTEELSGLLLAMSVFLVLPLTIIANLNIRVTLVTERLTGTVRRIAWIIGELILVAFLIVFANEAWKFYGTALRFNERSEQARLLLAPWKLATFAILALCVVCALWRAWRPPPKTGGTVI
jgi:TRAP-type C4-dicarboxylate transport system permease small subunit